MKKHYVDRLLESSFFDAAHDVAQININSMSKDFELVHDGFMIFILHEAAGHLDKISQLFKLIDNSIIKDREGAKEMVVNIIIERFAKIKPPPKLNLLETSQYCCGYRTGTIEKIYKLFRNLKDSNYKCCTDVVYNESDPQKLISGKTKYERFIIDFDNRDSDFIRLSSHFQNKFNEVIAMTQVLPYGGVKKIKNNGPKAPAIRVFCELVNDSELISKCEDEAAASYCKRVCKTFGLKYTDNVRKYFSIKNKIVGTDKNLIAAVELILPTIPDDSRNKIVRFIETKTKLYG